MLAFFLRAALPLLVLAFGGGAESFYAGDTMSYIRPATALIEEGGFNANGVPSQHRTLGYCLLLIPGILLGQVESITILAQIFLGCLSVFLVWKICLSLFGRESIALTGAFLLAVEPLSIYYCSKLLSETLFTTALLFFTTVFAGYLKNPKPSRLLFAALALTLCVYVRPVAYYFPIAAASIVISLGWLKKIPLKRALVHATVFLGACALLIGAWQVRNYLKTEYPGFSSITEINLYIYYGNAIKAALAGKPYDSSEFMEMWDEFNAHYEKKFPEDKSSGKRFSYMKQVAIRIILDHPLIFLKIYLKGLSRILVGPGVNGYLDILNLRTASLKEIWAKVKDHGVFKILSILKESPQILLANILFGGLLACYWGLSLMGLGDKNADRLGLALVVIIIAYLAAVSAGPYSYSRFRLPIMPYLCVLGGAGFWILRDKLIRFGKNPARTEPA